MVMRQKSCPAQQLSVEALPQISPAGWQAGGSWQRNTGPSSSHSSEQQSDVLVQISPMGRHPLRN
jgi:hypothetical protein